MLAIRRSCLKGLTHEEEQHTDLPGYKPHLKALALPQTRPATMKASCCVDWPKTEWTQWPHNNLQKPSRMAPGIRTPTQPQGGQKPAILG